MKDQEEKDAKKEAILKAVMRVKGYHYMINALDYINENPVLYQIIYEALNLIKK